MDKKLSMLDAMHYIASAWDAVTPETVANSFRYCGFKRSGACSTSEAAVPVHYEPEFDSLELPGSITDYVGADDDVAVCSAVSLDDIIETVHPDSAETSDEEERDDTAEACASVQTYVDVLYYVDNIQQFACACDEIGD
uniref:Centromere protein B n=1 Tax=Rhipicephalus zambeziensis TaxID=60191 RepID=A0A224YJK3_9ACAR